MNEPAYDARDLADAMESSVLALLRTPQIRAAFDDILRTYGLTGQFRELLSNQHEQIQAIAGIITMIYARLLDHDKRAIRMYQNIITIMDRQAARIHAEDAGSGIIAAAAAEAIALMHTEAEAAIKLIEAEDVEARNLLRQAQSLARTVLNDAVITAQSLMSDAAEQAAEATSTDGSA